MEKLKIFALICIIQGSLIPTLFAQKNDSMDQNSDSLSYTCWLYHWCDEPESSNIDSVKSLIDLEYLRIPNGERELVVARLLIDTNVTILKHKIINASSIPLQEVVEKYLYNLKFTMGECHSGYLRDQGITKYYVNVPFFIE